MSWDSYHLSENRSYHVIILTLLIYFQVLRRGRWAVSKSYKSEKYPPMTSGHMYILSRNAVSQSAEHYFSDMHPDLWIEDAYLTGVLRQSNYISL